MHNMKLLRAAVIITATVILVFTAGSNSNAALKDSGGYFLDTNTGWYWYAGVDKFVNQDWATAKDNVDELLLGGLIWELASASDIETLNSYYVPNDLLLSGIIKFTTPDNSVWGWLNDKASDSDERAVALLMFGEPDPQVKSFPESNKHPWIGAFAVSKPAGGIAPPLP